MIRQGRDGTRFRLYPKAHQGFLAPETVWVSPLPGTIGPGPSDALMHVIDAFGKVGPYAPPGWEPPYPGPIGPLAVPDREGHFDSIPIDDRTFLSAHMYGCVRRVLDIWEAMLRRPIVWWHAVSHPSLELIPLVNWDNAQSGDGFIEMGARRNDLGELQLFSLNFEIVGHETGHAILFSEVGVPEPERLTPQYLAFQESFADLIALISVMFFDAVIERFLEQTHGNLYVLNLISRIGELSQTQQIRIADNTTRMRDLEGLELDASGEWIDLTGAHRNAHDLAQPLTGAIFDILVEIYQDRLVARGIIAPDDDARGWTREEVEAAMADFEAHWGAAFSRFRPVFKEALLEARDVVAQALASTIDRLDANDLSFSRVGSLFTDACLDLGQTHHAEAIRENFLERDIPLAPPAPFAVRAAMLDRRQRPLRPHAAACLWDRVAAQQRARELSLRRLASEVVEHRRTQTIDRLLRRNHREADRLAND
jgi:hypothetical protein